MRIKFIALVTMVSATIISVVTVASATSQTNFASIETNDAQIPVHNVMLSPSATLTPTVYLPLIAKPRLPLFVGMAARWDSVGYGRGSEVWDAGYHLTRNLFSLTKVA